MATSKNLEQDCHPAQKLINAAVSKLTSTHHWIVLDSTYSEPFYVRVYQPDNCCNEASVACNLVAYFLKACISILNHSILLTIFFIPLLYIYVIILNDILLDNGLLSNQCTAKDNYASSLCAQVVTLPGINLNFATNYQ